MALQTVLESHSIIHEATMDTFLDFNFLTILNLFVLLLWPFSTSNIPNESARGAFNILMLILTAIAILADIFYLVLKFVHKI